MLHSSSLTNEESAKFTPFTLSGLVVLLDETPKPKGAP